MARLEQGDLEQEEAEAIRSVRGLGCECCLARSGSAGPGAGHTGPCPQKTINGSRKLVY